MRNVGGERSSAPGRAWSKWAWAASLPILVLWFLLRPRSGGGDLYLLHARALLGGTEPGQAIPEFPGSSAWIAYLIAAFEWIAIQLGPLREIAMSSALDRIEPTARGLLPVVWCILGATLVLIGGTIAVRIVRLASSRDPLSIEIPSFLIRALAILLLALSPALGRSITALSPALPAALLLAWMSWRLLGLVAPAHPDRSQRLGEASVGAGVFDGLPAGALLAWAPFAWPAAVLYFVSISVAKVSRARLTAALVVALGAGLVLDASRLVDLGGAIQRVRFEWAREGGWPLISGAFGAASPGEILFGDPALLWVWIGAFVTCAALLRQSVGSRAAPLRQNVERRASLLRPPGAIGLWIGGLWVLFRLLPAISGVRLPGSVQACGEPLWIAAAASAVALVPRARVLPSWMARALAISLPIGLTLMQAVQERSSGASSAALGSEIVQSLEQILEPGDLCLVERSLPGAERVPGIFSLPRDSRSPERYDFAYWSRWYSGFRYVLLSDAQVRQNLERNAPIARHFYQRLATDGRMLAEYGDPVSNRLFELPPESTWREPLTREELASVQAAPELGSFLSQLGSLYAENGDRRGAMILFEAGVRLDPDSDALANNLGSIYLLEREWQEAARIFQTALERSPESPELLYNFARALFELNVYVRAETTYRQAIALRPDFAAAHYELARCFLAQDKKLLAAAALRRYLELEPDSPRRAEVEGVLATLASEGFGTAPSGSGVETEKAIGVLPSGSEMGSE